MMSWNFDFKKKLKFPCISKVKILQNLKHKFLAPFKLMFTQMAPLRQYEMQISSTTLLQYYNIRIRFQILHIKHKNTTSVDSNHCNY